MGNRQYKGFQPPSITIDRTSMALDHTNMDLCCIDDFFINRTWFKQGGRGGQDSGAGVEA